MNKPEIVFPEVVPQDQYNLELVSNVHPSDWSNPEPAPCYNLVVIGGGTAGLVTAAGAAGLGAKVALVERNLLGGDCLNVGCVPSKALLASAKAVGAVRAAGALGVTVPGEVEVDFPSVMERMRRLRAGISQHDSAERFSSLGVDVFLGHARFVGSDRIDVDGRNLRFKRAVVASGARASAPPIPGLTEAGFLTNETVFSLTELPRRLAVIGAGPIGCELAQAFRRFGSEVYLLEKSPQVLTREDQDAAILVQQSLASDGVHLVLGSEIRTIETGNAKTIVLEKGGEGSWELEVDEILVGAGRSPNVEELDLETVGVDFDRKGVKVNDYGQ
jgi:pyruvate/2-oxoglutarate dehydrogenase complex dihydrolipoamide dehydrogenase (E3) component